MLDLVVNLQSELIHKKLRKLLFVPLLMLSGTSSALQTNFGVTSEFGLEVGGTYSREEFAPTYFANGYVGYERLSISAIASYVEERHELLLASMRYSGDGYHIDAGRIGVSSGTIPPIYNIVPPLASDPDIYSSITRTLLKVVGFPDIGFGLTMGNKVQVSLRAYTPQKRFIEDLIDGEPVFTPASTIQNIGPITPGECTLCDATGIGSASLIDAIVANALGITSSTIGIPEKAVNDPIRNKIDDTTIFYQAGIAWNDINWLVSVDHLHLEFGETRELDLTIAGLEYSNRYLTFGADAMYAEQLYGGGTYLVVPINGYNLYARYFYLNADDIGESFEVAAGVTRTFGRYAIRVGYEHLNILTIEESGLMLGFSYKL